MAAKKSKKSGKALSKKSMKKTKGGILIGLNQPTLGTEFHKIQQDYLKIQGGTTTKGGLDYFKI